MPNPSELELGEANSIHNQISFVSLLKVNGCLSAWQRVNH
jgi:hypothetical protein